MNKLIFIAALFTPALTTLPALAKDKTNYQGVMKSIPHANVEFDRGLSGISMGDQAKIRTFISDARAHGKIKNILVAAWSDMALPKAKGQQLSDFERKLASERIDALKSFIHSVDTELSVDAYNMAERSNWLAKTFGTSDAELKSLFSRKGAETPVTNAEYQVIKNEGGAREAVLVAVMANP